MPLINVKGRRITIKSIGLRGVAGPAGQGIDDKAENQLYGTQPIVSMSEPIYPIVADHGFITNGQANPQVTIYTDPQGQKWQLAVTPVSFSGFRLPTIRRRKYPEGRWEELVPLYEQMDELRIQKDNHNALIVCVTADGYIHVTGGVHSAQDNVKPYPYPGDDTDVKGMRYARSVAPYTMEFENGGFFLGEDNGFRSSYPQFFKHQGKDYIAWRKSLGQTGTGTGGIRNSKWVMGKYDEEDHEWKPVVGDGTILNGFVGDGLEIVTHVSEGPYPNIFSDGKRIHIVAYWETASTTNKRRFTYIRSAENDDSVWENPATGETINMPAGRDGYGEIFKVFDNGESLQTSSNMVVDSNGVVTWLTFFDAGPLSGGCTMFRRGTDGQWTTRAMPTVMDATWGIGQGNIALLTLEDKTYAIQCVQSRNTILIADITEGAENYGMFTTLLDSSAKAIGFQDTQFTDNKILFLSSQEQPSSNTYETTLDTSTPQFLNQTANVVEIDTRRIPEILRREHTKLGFRTLATHTIQGPIEVTTTTANTVLPNSPRLYPPALSRANQKLYIRITVGGYVTDEGDELRVAIQDGFSPVIITKVTTTNTNGVAQRSVWYPFSSAPFFTIPRAWLHTRTGSGSGWITNGGLIIEFGELI